MAFEPTNHEMQDALRQKPANFANKDSSPLPKQRGGRKKTYSFTIEPSSREILHQVAQDRGFPSDSAFLNEWIKGLK